MKHDHSAHKGLSLIETVIGVALFAAVSMMLYTTFSRVFTVARASQARVNAVAVANAQFEIIRNLSYSQVGTIAGIPAGVIAPVQTLVSGGMTFIATTTVRNVDYAFDGLAGGSPNDLSPADNKLVEIDLMCTTCKNFRPMIFTTTVGPKGLESSSTNGSLFIRAIDSAGGLISGATVHVVNNAVTPPIDFYDVTATSGMLQLIDAPPSAQSYQISVTKTGYSTEQTRGAPTTTNPVIPHATVTVQNVTQLTMAIDRNATLNFSSVSPSCGAVANTNFELKGAKLVATSPDVVKYDKFFTTGGSGTKNLNDIEWDTYALTATSAAYDVAGIVPLFPLSVVAGAVQNVQLVMVPKSPSAVMVTVKDLGTGLPITGATVTLEKGGASTTQTTGRGYLRQTDWGGGSGQSDFSDQTRYSSGDGNTDASTNPGSVQLAQLLGVYSPSGYIESSTFDTGAPANFYQFNYQPTTQPTDTGGDSARFQIATGNSTSSWTYLGPDGTNATYYNATSSNISSVNDGHRYFRYKMYLSTASSTLTPSVSDVQFTFTSACVPPGQVIFQGLTLGTYNVTVSAPGYTTYTGTVDVLVGTPWQELPVSIGP